VPTDVLPDNPDLDRLKRHAKDLRDLVRAGIEGSLVLVREHHPRFRLLVADSPEAKTFKLSDAQLTIARHYSFASWTKLRDYVIVVNRLTRSPHEELAAETPADDTADDEALAARFLRLACLDYGADSDDRWNEARRLVERFPRLAGFSIFTAAAVGDLASATEFLRSDPGLASGEGGPFAWQPLLYLTYSRLGPLPGTDPCAVAKLLLDGGADPNAGYLWNGLPSPFTALTGVFGRGEQGAPPHHQELALVSLLLEAGAEANDSQTIYNRGAGDIARDDTEFLELLLDFGLGHGDGGPWRRLLAHAHQTPTEIVAEALQHAAESGLERRTRLLLARGADPNIAGTHPGYRGRSPYAGAVLHGNMTVARLLADAGADTTGVDPLTRFVGACLSGDRSHIEATLVNDATMLATAKERHADLVARAAELGRGDAVRLLVELGFDVNARSRTTALHEAALRGDMTIIRLLVELGADPTIADTEFNATPAGWANHAGHTNAANYLEQLAISRSSRR
jgi:hypothetical protein